MDLAASDNQPQAQESTQVTRPPRCLSSVELMVLADLLERLHATAGEADLDALEAASRVVNRQLFRAWRPA